MTKRESSNNFADEIRVVDKSDTKLYNSLERMAARISELERSEANLLKTVSELQEHTDMYRTLVNLIPDGILVHVDGKVVFANPSAIKLFGVKNETELIGINFFDLFHPDSLQLLEESINAVPEDKMIPTLIEEKLKRLDGSIFDVEVTSLPHIYLKKPAVQVIFHEKTDRMEAEQELKHRLEFQRLVLNLSKSFLNIPMEKIDDGITDALRLMVEFFDVDRSYLYIESDGRKIFKNSYEWCAAGIDKNLMDTRIIRSIDYPWLMDKLERFEHIHITRISNLPPDARAERQMLQRRHVKSVIITPIIIGGTLTGFLGFDSVRKKKIWLDDSISLLRIVGEIIMNTIERKKATEELLKVQKLESIGTLAGGIAHNYNNFLTGILGNISLAKYEIDPKDEVYNMILNAEKSAIKSSELTQKLITFSGGGTPVKHKNKIDGIIKNSVDAALEGSNSICNISISKDLSEIEFDPGQMSQVIKNLIINADQAMPEGGKINLTADNVTIQTSNGLPVPKGNYIKITIEDSGSGIKKENIGKIFDPFFTTKPGNSGLGLAVVYSVITSHQGNIFVESTPGKGTKFTIYLPA